jgi:hypothetical protein
LWNHHTKETITFSVFSRPGLEESLQADRFLRVGVGSQEAARFRERRSHTKSG